MTHHSENLDTANTSSLLNGFKEEKQSAYLYRHMARAEQGSSREKLFRALGEAAERQAQIWQEMLSKSGVTALPRFKPSLRSKLVARLIGVVGPENMKPMLAAMKVRGLSIYTLHEVPTRESLYERRHKGSSRGGNLRAAVFGANDGLVSNASLMLGVAGGVHGASQSLQGADPKALLISGVAGLLAGAFSMASGEYISVRSQRELYEYQIGLEKEELEQYPQEEAMELALIYEAKGIPTHDARKMADQIIADPARALDTLAREELGLNPQELGSPVGAATSSFFSFAIGALIPLLPFLILHSSGAGAFVKGLQMSILLTVAALVVMGSVLSLFTGKSALWGGFRMLLLGSVAGGATWLIGSFLGVAVQ